MISTPAHLMPTPGHTSVAGSLRHLCWVEFTECAACRPHSVPSSSGPHSIWSTQTLGLFHKGPGSHCPSRDRCRQAVWTRSRLSGLWYSLSPGHQFPCWLIFRANLQVAWPLQPWSEPFSPLDACLSTCETGLGVLALGAGSAWAGSRGGKRTCTHLCPFPPHRHHLCRSRHYCHDVSNHVETLYPQVERLVQQAGHQADSSISFYYFNASLYLLRVLKGSTADRPVPKTQKKEKASTDPSTKPKGSRVRRPWPRKARPRNPVLIDRGRSPAAGWDHLPILQMGS